MTTTMTPRARHELARKRRAAVIATLLILAVVVFTFAKGSLFGGGYEVRAVIEDANQLRSGSEVRIGGIRVGEISGIEAGPGDTSVIRMRIEDEGRPVRSDATLTVKPRLVLEGNAYVDLSSGTPSAPELAEDATIPLAQTAVTPQLDQVLGVLDAPTRGALHRGIAGLDDALGSGPPQPAELAGSGTRGLRRAVKELDGALGDITTASRAMRGTRPGDLPRAVRGTGDMVAQLATDPRALAASVTNFNRVFAALADEQRALGASISGFDRVLRAAPASLRRIDGALPTVTRFADALRPALHEAPAALRSANAVLDQVGAVTRRRELPTLLDRLRPVTADLPALESRLQALFGYTDLVAGCAVSNIIPVLNSKLQDGKHTTGDPVWLDLLHSFTGFTSASTSFDGNGGTFRAGLAFGPVALQGIVPGLGSVAGNINQDILGVRPAWLGYGVDPAYRPDAKCSDQKLPKLNVDAAPAPRWTRLSKAPATRKARP